MSSKSISERLTIILVSVDSVVPAPLTKQQNDVTGWLTKTVGGQTLSNNTTGSLKMFVIQEVVLSAVSPFYFDVSCNSLLTQSSMLGHSSDLTFPSTLMVIN